LASGGLVTLIMPMSDGTEKPQIAGICQEVIDRLDTIGAAFHPRKKDLGTEAQDVLEYWKNYAFCVISLTNSTRRGCIRGNSDEVRK
jgi:hypothetical protein